MLPCPGRNVEPRWSRFRYDDACLCSQDQSFLLFRGEVMERARQWIGGALLRAPESLRSIRKWPVLGTWMHRLSHAVLPLQRYHWAQVKTGPGKGLWIELNPRTGEKYLRGVAEESVQHVFAKHLRPGMVFYDLGANIGLFSLIAARIVGPEGHVYSFEPDSTVAARLRRNIARNLLLNVTVVEAGAWSSSTKLGFIRADSASPDGGTGQFVDGQSEGAMMLDCIALDDFVKSHPAPAAIKCDVEGAEVEVLRGAENLIRTHRPWIVGETHSAANARDWSEFLARFGYKSESLDANHIFAIP